MNSHATPDAPDDGQWLLAHPILPLVRIVRFLYLTGPFDTVAEVLTELTEPIETNTGIYQEPASLLTPYLPIMAIFEAEKAGRGSPDAIILNEQREPMEGFAALDHWVAQQILTVELERLNSILCRPCGCVLCCEGPVVAADGGETRQHFFEIPLNDTETKLFELPVLDTEESRSLTALDDPGLSVDGRPFYEGEPALYKWRTGWSMILPRARACPHLDRRRFSCAIYPQRPEVCRRPQVFPYALERAPELDEEREGRLLPAYYSRGKLLAVWDCPYVKRFKEEIAQYAELCELEPVFMENKG